MLKRLNKTMAKTNHLGSHHPERRSYNAEKRIPKDVVKDAKGGRKVLKKMHNKKSRNFSKQKIKKELGDGE